MGLELPQSGALFLGLSGFFQTLKYSRITHYFRALCYQSKLMKQKLASLNGHLHFSGTK